MYVYNENVFSLKTFDIYFLPKIPKMILTLVTWRLCATKTPWILDHSRRTEIVVYKVSCML